MLNIALNVIGTTSHVKTQKEHIMQNMPWVMGTLLAYLFAAHTAWADTLILEWTNPTTNADGTELTDLARVRICLRNAPLTVAEEHVCAYPVITIATTEPGKEMTWSGDYDFSNTELTLYIFAVAEDDAGNQSLIASADPFPHNKVLAPNVVTGVRRIARQVIRFFHETE